MTGTNTDPDTVTDTVTFSFCHAFLLELSQGGSQGGSVGVSRVVMRMMMICPGVSQLVEYREGRRKEGRKEDGNRDLRGIGHRPTNGRPHNKEGLFRGKVGGVGERYICKRRGGCRHGDGPSSTVEF